MTIYERLSAMAVTYRRVTDERTLPGAIEHRVPTDQWTAVDESPPGCLMAFVRPEMAPEHGGDNPRSCDNIAVVVTRFVFDHGVDIADLVDHAPVAARALDSWREESYQRWPIGTRHSGWARVAGTHISDGQARFRAAAYVVHDRGNVGYLVDTTATVRDIDLSDHDRTDVIDAITSINFVD